MTEFRARLRTRTLLAAVSAFLIAAAAVSLLLAGKQVAVIPDYLRMFQAGAFTGLELIIAAAIARNLVSLRNDEALKRRYILETDERRLMILQKTGSAGMNIGCVGLAAAAVAAGFFSQAVFLSLLGAAVFLAAVKGALKLYYSNKF